MKDETGCKPRSNIVLPVCDVNKKEGYTISVGLNTTTDCWTVLWVKNLSVFSGKLGVSKKSCDTDVYETCEPGSYYVQICYLHELHVMNVMNVSTEIHISPYISKIVVILLDRFSRSIKINRVLILFQKGPM